VEGEGETLIFFVSKTDSVHTGYWQGVVKLPLAGNLCKTF
jgi:hypothetical protein